jgi:hypothetical protein
MWWNTARETTNQKEYHYGRLPWIGLASGPISQFFFDSISVFLGVREILSNIVHIYNNQTPKPSFEESL